MEEFKVGDRVAKDLKKQGNTPAHTAYGTIAYVKPDRVGVAWDARAPYVFPAQRDEIRLA